MDVTNVSYTYEVAYIIRPDNTECSGDLTTLPDGYTVYPVNTSSDNIEVFGLIPGTCYAFEVRVYTSISDSPGEFTVRQRDTASDVTSSSVSIGLIGGAAGGGIVAVMIMLLIVIVIVIILR